MFAWLETKYTQMRSTEWITVKEKMAYWEIFEIEKMLFDTLDVI